MFACDETYAFVCTNTWPVPVTVRSVLPNASKYEPARTSSTEPLTAK